MNVIDTELLEREDGSLMLMVPPQVSFEPTHIRLSATHLILCEESTGKEKLTPLPYPLRDKVEARRDLLVTESNGREILRAWELPIKKSA